MTVLHKAANPQISIGKMSGKHVAAVFDLALASRLSYWSRADYLTETQRPDALCLVAETESETEKQQKKLVGFLIARLIMNDHCAELNNIAVAGAERFSGIGKRLLTELSKVSIDNNLDRILLEVRSSNRAAVDFYRRCGFETVGIRKKFYREPPEDGLTMMKNLTRN